MQGGLTHEKRRSAVSEDYWLGVTPEVTLFVVDPRWQLQLTYALTGALHTRFPTEIANRLSMSMNGEVSRRTTFFLTAEGNQSTLSTFLLTRPVTATPVSVLPPSATHLLTLATRQGLTWEASPVVKLGESIDGTYVTTLDSSPRFNSQSANLTLTADRTWEVDSLGLEARGGVAVTSPPPPDLSQKLVTLNGGPRWGHDFSRSLSSTVSAGPAMIASVSSSSKPRYSVAGRGSLLYTWETASAELIYAHGFEPSILFAQVLRSHQGTLRGTFPISQEARVYASASVGYQWGTFVNLRANAVPRSDIQLVLADVGIGWGVLDWLQVFGRYQLFAQTGGAIAPNEPPLTRNAVVLGVQLQSDPPGGSPGVGARRPQRVDQSDVAR